MDNRSGGMHFSIHKSLFGFLLVIAMVYLFSNYTDLIAIKAIATSEIGVNEVKNSPQFGTYNCKSSAEQLLFTSNSSTILQQSKVASRVLIEDETLSAPRVLQGEMLNVTGLLISQDKKPVTICISLLITTNTGKGWELIEKDPPVKTFSINPEELLPFFIGIKALEPGQYQVHALLQVDGSDIELGPGYPVEVMPDH